MNAHVNLAQTHQVTGAKLAASVDLDFCVDRNCPLAIGILAAPPRGAELQLEL